MQMLYFVYYQGVEEETLFFCGKTLAEAEDYVQNQIMESDYFDSKEDFLIKYVPVSGFVEKQTREVNRCLKLLWAAQRKLSLGLAAISDDASLIVRL